MATKSRNINDGFAESKRDKIHTRLLEEAIKGLADLNAGKTLSLSQIRSRFRGKGLSSEQRLNKALRSLKGFLKGDRRPWPYR